jgi:hypothetical protein
MAKVAHVPGQYQLELLVQSFKFGVLVKVVTPAVVAEDLVLVKTELMPR